MGISFRLRLVLVFSLLLIIISGFAFPDSRRFPVLAATSSHALSVKQATIHLSSTVSCGSWNVITSPNLLAGNNAFYGVTAISAADIWAVGYYTSTFNGQDYDQTLTEHWNGNSWGVVTGANPGLGGNIFNGAVAVNAKSVWAVGASWDLSGNTVQALIEHWNGRAWKVVPSPIVAEQLTAITRVPGTNQLWAVGLGGLIEHWDGTSWSIVSSPNTGALKGITAHNTSDIWAVGLYGGNSSQALIEHWDGTSWSVVSNPSVGTDSVALDGVTRVPGSNKIWTAGYVALPTSPSQTLTERWNGTSWKIISSPNEGLNNNFVSGITALSASDIWLVGGFVNNAVSNMPQALIEHGDGKNWNLVSSPSLGSNNSFLEAITPAPGTNQLWAVGMTIDNNDLYQTLIETYQINNNC